jgi:hypothetical protein
VTTLFLNLLGSKWPAEVQPTTNRFILPYFTWGTDHALEYHI